MVPETGSKLSGLYNPRGCSPLRTSLNFMIIGAGLRMLWIAGPLVQCGWLLGFAIISLIGALSAYLVLGMFYAYSDLRMEGISLAPSYSGLCKQVLGDVLGLAAWFCFNATVFGFQSATLVFAGSSLHEATGLHQRTSVLVLFLAMLPLIFVRTTSALSYVSLAGLTGSAMLMVTVVVAAINRLSSEGPADTFMNAFPMNGNGELALSQTVMVFNMAMGAVPQMGGMKDAKKFPVTVACTFSVLAVVYSFMAAIIFISWGELVTGEINAMAVVLKEGVGYKLFVSIAVVVLSIAQYTSGIFGQGVSTDTISKNRMVQILLRFILHTSQSCLAYFTCKDLGTLVNLVARVIVPFVALFFPALIMISHSLKHKKKSILEMALLFSIVLSSLVLASSGAYRSYQKTV